jgi:hypothetical protein
VNLCYSPENHSPSRSEIVMDSDTSLGTCRPTERLKDLKKKMVDYNKNLGVYNVEKIISKQ